MRYLNFGLVLFMFFVAYQQEERIVQLNQEIANERLKTNLMVYNLNITNKNVEAIRNRLDRIDLINSLPGRKNLDDAFLGGYFGEGKIVCLPQILYCQHEVGHALDEFLEFPSQTDEFKADVIMFLEQCYANSMLDENIFCNMIGSFPGINNNFMLKSGERIEWGGYAELYASIFEKSHTQFEPIPNSLYKYFDK